MKVNTQINNLSIKHSVNEAANAILSRPQVIQHIMPHIT